MFRGVLGGFLAGTIVSGLVLGAASVLTDIPGQAPPRAATVEVPAGSEFKRAREDTQAALPGADRGPEADSAPRVAAPEPDDLSSLQGADTMPASHPETGAAESTLTEPGPQSDSAGVSVDSDEPVLPSPQALAPEAPGEEADPTVSTDTTRPAQPEARAESPISAEPAQPALPEVEEDSGVFTEPAQAPPTPEPALTPPQEPAPEPAQAPLQEPAQERMQTGIEDQATEDQATEGQATEDRAATGASEPEAPSGTIGDLAENVTTGRLPSVTDTAPLDDALPPPLERFAAPFSNPEGKPLMAIVLIDDGQNPIGHEALSDFPYPISYAIDADWPGATAAAAKYRAAGLEVLAMVDLPPGATAADVEVAMQAYLSAVPEAVAVMEGTGSGLQSSREVIRQLIPILKESGHGLVLFSKGFDTARKLIAREGVPVASVFRDFDGEGQTASVIRRFLDQAAFRASQQPGGVIMVGRLRAETVSALLLWGLQDRAASVALAPVSAILRAGK